ncbi:MAG: pantoate--beta-alanine ligase [Elusimicrobia bacterium]|nr:pantoate--beta-alanine ligase [Elusimicrobiota bacterium]
MKIIKTPTAMSDLASSWRRRGLTIGFVPTMGALHQGHASLIRRARAENDRVTASVFVNPAQFGPKEDFLRYPRPFAADCALAAQEGADAVFHPEPADVYPRGSSTFVEVAGLSGLLCGAFRPGHFRGVATVVLKLLNIVQPDRAYFGEKDYQQLVVIKSMARDLALPVRVVGCPTVRESDGLAMSSRNAYLSPAQRLWAPRLHEALAWGARSSRVSLVAAVRKRILGIPGASIDYVSLVDPDTLAPAPAPKAQAVRRGLRLLAAVRIGRARLIDNVIVS